MTSVDILPITTNSPTTQRRKQLLLIDYSLAIKIEVLSNEGSQFDKKQKEILNSSKFSNLISKLSITTIYNKPALNKKETFRVSYNLKIFLNNDVIRPEYKHFSKLIDFKIISPTKILKYANLFIMDHIKIPKLIYKKK